MPTPALLPDRFLTLSRLRHLVLTGLCATGSLALGGCYPVGVVAEHLLGDHTVYCKSLAEARAAKLYADTVLVEPRTARYGPYTVTFSNCFIAQTRDSHRPSWYARRMEKEQPNAWVSLRYCVNYTGQRLPQSWDKGAPLLDCKQGTGRFLNTVNFGQTYDMGFDAALITENHIQYVVLELPIVLTITGHEAGVPDTLRLRAYPADLRAQLPR